MSYYSLNGKYYSENEKNISINNRSFRYGDGFFETIKIVNQKILLKELHFNRISKSLDILNFQLPKHFSLLNLETQIIDLAQKNGNHFLGRIRVTFFRNDGGLFDNISHIPNILVQSFELNESANSFNENGLQVDVYLSAKKSCDLFSNIKSNNYLQYAMAALWAKEYKLNDALLLNSDSFIADSTIANVFIIKQKIIKTPALSNGCIDGVMRRYIIDVLSKQNIKVLETNLTIDDIEHADEVFLTNAIKGIRWVKNFRDTTYTNFETQKIIKLINETYC